MAKVLRLPSTNYMKQSRSGKESCKKFTPSIAEGKLKSIMFENIEKALQKTFSHMSSFDQ